LRDAIASVADEEVNPLLDAPATSETILKAIEDTQQAAQQVQHD